METLNYYWTDEERATLREVYYAVLPPGQFRKPELLRRLPGRTYNAIRHQILTLGLTHPEAQKWRRVRDPGLAGKIYEALTRHGPMSSAELTELLGLDLRLVTNAVGHLVRRSALVKEGSRPHRWRINTTPPGPVRRNRNPPRRADESAGITEEDHAWMRRYRDQRARRMAQMGEQRCS